MKRQRSLETLGILSSGIAHDFNNLLVTIIGNADLALRKLEADSPAYRYIRHIKTASVRASGLTGQLLAYAGNETIIREPVDLNAVIEEMASLFSTAMPPHISMTFRFSEETPVVLANEQQIRQVVMNLITNAIDAISDYEGEIVIKTGISDSVPYETANNRDEQKYGFFRITDSGCGIAMEIKEKIFEPFFTTKRSGRGLGLAIVGEHVAGNQGIITVENRTDGCSGAQFTAWFPMSDLPAVPAVNYDENTDSINMSGTILVIDDEADVRETTCAMLVEAGFTVLTAKTGHEGLTLFERDPHAIDLVLLDMTLPAQDGYVVTKELRLQRHDIPIIMSSGYRCDDHNEKRDHQIDAFLRKPYQMSVLVGAINSVLLKKVERDA